MKADPEAQTRIQAETIAAISARCDDANQFDNLDRAFRHWLTVSKDAVLKYGSAPKEATRTATGEEVRLDRSL
jgi:hypothetical protein